MVARCVPTRSCAALQMVQRALHENARISNGTGREWFCCTMRTLFLAAAIIACSAESPRTTATFAGPPLVTLPTESGKAVVAVRTSPSPLARGTTSIELTFEDTTGKPLDDMTLTVVPWMAAHAHGTSVVPVVTPQGGGRYVVTEVQLFMPGSWQLRIDTGTDRVAPILDVP